MTLHKSLSERGEIDNPEANRNWLIEQRNKALIEGNFELAVGLSHTISWMALLIEILEEQKNATN